LTLPTRLWIGVTFVVGVAVGVLVMRHEKEESVSTALPNDAASVTPAAPQLRADAARPDHTPRSATSSPSPAVAEPIERVPNPSTGPVMNESVDYAGYSLPVDVGPAFRKEVAAAPVPGVSNALAEAHRALEREMRDDSWSYPMEAEIQNSLAADASVGNFTVEHIECRATLCEIHLSGRDEQAEAMSSWATSLRAQPLGSRLLPSVLSTTSDGKRTDQLLILMKPPKPPKPD
jgi:hypothetical protein